MTKDYREHVDPEHRRWAAKYPRFPGVGECVRLIEAGKATGAWADIVVDEIARHSSDVLDEIVAAYREHPAARLFLLMALEIGRPASAVPFLTSVLNDGEPHLVAWGEKGLGAIDTREARTALWQHRNGPPTG